MILYYKYHIEVPRLFMLPTQTLIKKHLDKQKAIIYDKITNIIEQKKGKDLL